MYEDLVTRFAPVLFLHPSEKFFPVDPKRFMENSNLWLSKPPYDDKTLWGGTPGTAFPRQPLVKAGEVNGVAGEGGTLLDDAAVVPTDLDELFLELGGWKDGSEMHEADVTQTSSNLRADRAVIEDMYSSGPLHDSRFWYYAEMFDSTALKKIAAGITAPDFMPMLTDNSTLLCFYLFFPAHEQAVDMEGCDTAEAKEVACHAGDWQCVAIMLEGDGSDTADSYVPKFFGCTGSLVRDGDPSGFFRPNAPDDEGLTTMTVELWQPDNGTAQGLPKLDAGRPR